MKIFPTVFVIDDDAAVRDGLALQLEAAEFRVQCYESAAGFLNDFKPQSQGCLLLDVRMPEMTGPELQVEMIQRGINLPIIFLTGHGDIPLAVKTIQIGAVDFLTKPVDADQLVDCIQKAFALNAEQHKQNLIANKTRECLAALSTREHEVLKQALDGHSNKIIAQNLGISFRTVEHYRSNILLKTGADNLLELARWIDSSQKRQPPVI